MFSALWNAASMLTGGGRESWETSRQPASSPTSSLVHSHSEPSPDNWGSPRSTLTHSRVDPPFRASTSFDEAGRPPPPWAEAFGDAGFSEDWMCSNGSKLFIQLMDDLDDLSTNSPSAHRRRRARELFSDWIFSGDMHSVAGFERPGAAALVRNNPLRRSNALDYGVRRPATVREETVVARRCSGDFSALDIVSSDCGRIAPVRLRDDKPADRGGADRRRSVPPNMFSLETESDSGYHTACRTVLPNNYRKRVPGQHTLTREDLHRRISAFNTNNHGLIMEMPTGDSNTFQGFIRVHMNLIRPINMCISLDPPTLHDICANPDSQQSSSATMKNMQVTSFYLPKDTTKVIHISSRTTTEEVIQVLLAKYHITDNPRKFALYEKTQEHNKTAVLRRLLDDEVPLQICLSWTSEGVECLDHNQFVLQENDTGEILWEAFSLPELENFLVVLNREEEEYINQVNSKYRLLKVQMTKRLQKIEPKKKKVPTATLR